MFVFRKPTFLGVDFGTSSVKAIELRIENGQAVLENYAEISLHMLHHEIQISQQTEYDAYITTFLRALLERMQPKTREMYVAMPSFIGLVALVELPKMTEKELEDAIRFEAHRYIPSPLEDITLSWEIVGEPAEGRVEVLLVAALNKEVERYESYVQLVDYKMQLLELETFSLVRSVVGNDPGVFLVADIGSRATNIVLTEDGIVKVSRNLDVGGKDITRVILESMGVDADQAEQLKKGDVDYLNESANAKLLFPAFEMIAAEMARMIASHNEKKTDRPVSGIILSGGTAQMTGLTTYYQSVFGLPVSIGDPWKRVQYPLELESAVRRMGTSFSVAIGLALQGVNQHMKRKQSSLGGHSPQEPVWKRFFTQLTKPIGDEE